MTADKHGCSISKQGPQILFAFKFELSNKRKKNKDEVQSKDIYSSVIVEDKQAKQLPVICEVIEIMTLSSSTASCERGFSSQNIVKTKTNKTYSEQSEKLVTCNARGSWFKRFLGREVLPIG